MTKRGTRSCLRRCACCRRASFCAGWASRSLFFLFFFSGVVSLRCLWTRWGPPPSWLGCWWVIQQLEIMLNIPPCFFYGYCHVFYSNLFASTFDSPLSPVIFSNPYSRSANAVTLVMLSLASHACGDVFAMLSLAGELLLVHKCTLTGWLVIALSPSRPPPKQTNICVLFSRVCAPPSRAVVGLCSISCMKLCKPGVNDPLEYSQWIMTGWFKTGISVCILTRHKGPS